MITGEDLDLEIEPGLSGCTWFVRDPRFFQPIVKVLISIDLDRCHGDERHVIAEALREIAGQIEGSDREETL